MPVVAERVAHVLLRLAARRWPAGMHQEWSAELASLRGRPWRMLTFAGSLAITSASGMPRAAAVARAGTAAMLVVLLSAALFNGVHLALHRAETRLPWSGEATLVGALLAVAMLLMAGAGARWRPRRPVPATLLIGAAAYAFLLAGNETPVMPFMGWRDVTPAVATWTAVTAMSSWAAVRLRAAGRTRRAAVVAVGGGLLALHTAAAAGSLHAAATLGLSSGSAPAWFPLAMLPGGTGGFGTYFAGGQPAISGLPGSGPAFHASDILLANTAALSGPLLLCSAFLCAAALTPSRRPGRAASPLIARLHGRADPLIVAASGTAAAVLLLAGHMPRAVAAEAALPRLVDNSMVFGFGFLAHPAGRAALAFAVALLIAHHLAARERRA
ncbi:hypothetical protein [Actinoplanes aureus]|uniref:Uncharacterized protein n=1 Tax=Actinoplanes aureus TaxID=2792083 RepID=A0A931G1A8_9ACTN|nr:hypothetical protein [Actinoplanes aureus]MBG0567688.1 hypothetical protein [Actinoplanes aureus]